MKCTEVPTARCSNGGVTTLSRSSTRAVLGGDEPDALLGVEARHAAAVLGRMKLHVAALAARVVLEPPPGGVERVAQRHLQILVVLARDRELAAGHLEVDVHAELLALALVARGKLEHHAAAHDVVVIALELLRLFADGVVKRVRVLDAVERSGEGFACPYLACGYGLGLSYVRRRRRR